MDLKKLREMLKIVAQSDVDEVEIEEDGTKVTIRKNTPTISVQPSGFYPQVGMYPQPQVAQGHPPAVQTTPPAAATPPPVEVTQEPAAETGIVINAPIVGTFYAASSPDAEPFVKVGSKVNPGDVLCIIEAMKLMNEIESEVSGTVTKILVENTNPVEYDQPLFVVEKDR